MIRNKLLDYENQLVKIITVDDYEILDYYDYNYETGFLLTESYQLELHEEDIYKLELVKNNIPREFLKFCSISKRKSKYIN